MDFLSSLESVTFYVKSSVASSWATCPSAARRKYDNSVIEALKWKL